MSRKSLLCLYKLAIVISAVALYAADGDVDFRKVRKLRQRVLSGETLTPEEQAYYERGKATRQKGEGRAKKNAPAPQAASAVAKTSTGLTPLCDMGPDQKYRGEEGGLYGGGANSPPATHWQAALAMATKIQPLNAEGLPSPNGKIVLLTHGMSNTTNESQRFIELANADTRKNPAVLVVDGAQGGVDSRQWVSGKPTRSGSNPWDRLAQRIKLAGATPQQVQVVWMKHAVARVGQYGEFPKHAQQLQNDMAQIVRLLKAQFPNLHLVFISSRSYGGYATTELNPEPYAYESAFAVRWLIQDQINGSESLSYSTGKAPLLLWGPYLWADGENGRQADDLTYRHSDYRDDGTHPSETGRQKIAEQLLRFFNMNLATKSWFNVSNRP
jgi:hypothetical protein